MSRTLHGKVHGKTIQLDEDPGVVDGQEVEVQVRLVLKQDRKPGDGILAPRELWPTTPSGMRSWTKSIRPGNMINE